MSRKSAPALGPADGPGPVDSPAPPRSSWATLPHRGTRHGSAALEAAPGRKAGAGVGWAMLLVGVVAFAAAAAGILLPATQGTWNTADETK